MPPAPPPPSSPRPLPDPPSAQIPAYPTGIVAPMPEELAPLRRRIRGGRRRAIDGQAILHGRIGAVPVVLTCCGDGAERARRGIERLLDAVPVARLLLVGVAGGLDPGLRVGAVLIAREVVDPHGRRAPGPDPTWLAAAIGKGGARAGVLVTAPAVVTGTGAKDALWRGVAGGRPAAVDLESFACAETAAARGVPYLIARAIGDTADEPLPAFIGRCQRADGSVDRIGILRHGLRHPGTVPALLRLRSRVAHGAGRLARLAPVLLVEPAEEASP